MTGSLAGAWGVAVMVALAAQTTAFPTWKSFTSLFD